MPYQFRKHYTRDEASALLPQIRQWLDHLGQLQHELADYDRGIGERLSKGVDVGGEPVNRWMKIRGEIETILGEFQKREIQIKDLDRGLVDFPAFVGGQEVFLCWEKDEDDVEFWHTLTSGYSGRERL